MMFTGFFLVVALKCSKMSQEMLINSYLQSQVSSGIVVYLWRIWPFGGWMMSYEKNIVWIVMVG